MDDIINSFKNLSIENDEIEYCVYFVDNIPNIVAHCNRDFLLQRIYDNIHLRRMNIDITIYDDKIIVNYNSKTIIIHFKN